jgi:hypothetical protein
VVGAIVLAACAGPMSGPGPLPTLTIPVAAENVRNAEPSESAEPAESPAPTPEPAPRSLVQVAGIELAAVASPAKLHVAPTISREDEAVIADAVAADIDAVQREFERSFSTRPVIYVFADNGGYAEGLARIFGYSETTAAFVAENSVSFFEPRLLAIAVNWQAIGDRRPVAAIRHELTHRLTIDACGARCDLVPAWFNEGQARLSEALVPGAEWRLARVRYEAASMAATNTLIPLNTLVSQLSWNALTDWAGYYKYQEAARATELLRTDVGGSAPIARLYERIRRGENIAQAYASLTGRSFDEFVAGLAARMREAVPPVPGLLTLAGASQGTGPSYLLYGFPPSTEVLVTVSGARATESWPVVVSPFGASFDGIAPTRPRGTYTISVQHAGRVLTATVAKKSPGVRLSPR